MAGRRNGLPDDGGVGTGGGSEGRGGGMEARNELLPGVAVAGVLGAGVPAAGVLEGRLETRRVLLARGPANR